MSFIDIHTHGQFSYEGQNIISVKSLSDKELLDHNSDGMFSAGIHPWWTLDYSLEELENFKKKIIDLCRNDSLFALGETGLDRGYKETFDLQKELFLWHIELSEKEELPLVIHSVRSGSDILEILKSQKPQMPWIFHDFRGNMELVSSITKLHPHVYFSFGISLDNSQTIRELIREIKIEKVFLETDAQKHLDIADIYLRASEQTGLNIDLLKSLLFQNFKRLCNQT
ncbi:MAG TPA: TatD family hydrolase [Bacteriovoracaceae bacterium]|nr:TatD family hydrolase [Bacteriovoracaceae bacterium]